MISDAFQGNIPATTPYYQIRYAFALAYKITNHQERVPSLCYLRVTHRLTERHSSRARNAAGGVTSERRYQAGAVSRRIDKDGSCDVTRPGRCTVKQKFQSAKANQRSAVQICTIFSPSSPPAQPAPSILLSFVRTWTYPIVLASSSFNLFSVLGSMILSARRFINLCFSNGLVAAQAGWASLAAATAASTSSLNASWTWAVISVGLDGS